jgi:hypothetical protein
MTWTKNGLPADALRSISRNESAKRSSSATPQIVSPLISAGFSEVRSTTW